LKKAKQSLAEKNSTELKEDVIKEIEACLEMTVEYVEIVNSETLKPLEKNNSLDNAHILAAVNLGNVRLIDNLALND